MLYGTARPTNNQARQAIRSATLMDEKTCLETLIKAAYFPLSFKTRVANRAKTLIEGIRSHQRGFGVDAFMAEYSLSSQEGVALMCLAEALLRIPDARTSDQLIQDLLGNADWETHQGHSDSLFVNASTWGLMMTGHLLQDTQQSNKGVLTQLAQRTGEQVIRAAITQAMKILGEMFVLGRTIEEALDRAKTGERAGYCYSYDMLGEAARTQERADQYFAAYHAAIAAAGSQATGLGPENGPGISVKLSALHPRFEFAQRERVLTEMVPKLINLAKQAKDANIGFAIDAEEAERLDLMLDVIDLISAAPSLAGWNGLGLALQSYQKRALPIIEWLSKIATRDNRQFMVRLVKGAYWDSEIKWAQVAGLKGYPVFTRKANTDVSFMACAKALAQAPDAFYPAFATHNAHTLASVLELMGDRRDFELQRLHGMGDDLYEPLMASTQNPPRVRVYAPVGSHEELLAYLVRRLLENGANTSFVNRTADKDAPIEDLIADPVETALKTVPAHHPNIPLPRDLFGSKRLNSQGIDLADPMALEALEVELANAIIPSEKTEGAPAKPLAQILEVARGAQLEWDALGGNRRAEILEGAADLFEQNRGLMLKLLIREGGKTLPDAIAELREAVDFLRYYAGQARKDFVRPLDLPGPTGELNQLALHGRGAFICISPWNFPLAIFTGQVAAALAAGNSALAKPASATPIVAKVAIDLLHQAGVPSSVLHFTPANGAAFSQALMTHPHIGGVAFTGSSKTAQSINRALADRDGPIVPLIAETGGQNAMIVDSSALPEQVTRDVLASAFQSAGQRCSALRVLFVQDDVADRQIAMIAKAMAELRVGDPALLSTDVGPMIDQDAVQTMQAHVAKMELEGTAIGQTPLPKDLPPGPYFAPIAFEIDRIDRLEGEVFGPILHVIRFAGDRLDAVVDSINGTGFGLTLSVHSRLQSTIDRVTQRAHVGNLYINRNQIGAVVGVQPFGGEGLSGTGPKAGGPRYLHRFATERTISNDTTASGGNAALLSLE